MKVCLVGCIGARFKAYLYVLLSSNRVTDLTVIVYGGAADDRQQKSLIKLTSLSLLTCNDFKVAEIFSFFGRVDNCMRVGCDSINSKRVLSALARFEPDFAVFCGKPGEIVHRDTLDRGPLFLHMHPGELPRFRGSTTLYYSYLLERAFSVTAFFMSADIDNGEIVRVDHYDPLSVPFELDVVGDCFVRAETLRRTLDDLSTKDLVNREVSDGEGGHAPVRGSGNNIYYVIHPLLKQVAVHLRGNREMDKHKL